ncbi:hypothetical protein [Streptomyces seoulensis]|uniref:hypothetical protein n=1 Tax=Streptomyces seoulensis TaxID=73044 RepID=UPI001FCAA5AD|nr:hypothetical protein [Streptomyces seoulensis]BDH07177.1 hypothetical protein HEK131_44040 [Streptomyces seoulensis]
MRVRVVTTTLGITAALLALPACSTEITPTTSDTATSARKPADTGTQAAPLSSAALEARLLDEHDLGSGYLREPERPTRHDDVTVVGCPALSKLGGDAATGGSPSFAHQAKAAFTYAGGSNSDVSEELYSDRANTLSDGTGRIFDAMTGCPTYQVVTGDTPIDVSAQKLPAPHGLGDEQWSQLLTFSAAGRSTVMKQVAIRKGSVLVIVSGSPALVDLQLEKALAKATVAN